MEIIVFSIEAMYRYVSCGLYAALHALAPAHSIGSSGCQASEGPPHIESVIRVGKMWWFK